MSVNRNEDDAVYLHIIEVFTAEWREKNQADEFGVLEKINTPKHHKGNCPLINNLYSENFSSFRITLRHREHTASANSYLTRAHTLCSSFVRSNPYTHSHIIYNVIT